MYIIYINYLWKSILYQSRKYYCS